MHACPCACYIECIHETRLSSVDCFAKHAVDKPVIPPCLKTISNSQKVAVKCHLLQSSAFDKAIYVVVGFFGRGGGVVITFLSWKEPEFPPILVINDESVYIWITSDAVYYTYTVCFLLIGSKQMYTTPRKKFFKTFLFSSILPNAHSFPKKLLHSKLPSSTTKHLRLIAIHHQPGEGREKKAWNIYNTINPSLMNASIFKMLPSECFFKEISGTLQAIIIENDDLTQ